MEYQSRGAEQRISDQLSTDPLVIVEGARAIGKTSLANHLVNQGRLSAIRSFADEQQLAVARADARPVPVDGLHPVASQRAGWERPAGGPQSNLERTRLTGSFIVSGDRMTLHTTVDPLPDGAQQPEPYSSSADRPVSETVSVALRPAAALLATALNP